MSLQTSLLGSERESGGFTVPSSDAEHPAAPAPAPAPAPAAGTSPLPTAAAAAAAQSYAALAGRTWKLALAAFLVTTHRNIDLQIFQPYAYSRVSCCGLGGGPMLSPSYSYGGHSVQLSVTAKSCECDLAAVYPAAPIENGTIAPCDVPFIAADSALWSHSASCANWPYVMLMAQTVTSGWYSTQTVLFILVMPLCARISDVYGRRDAFLYATAAVMLAVALFAVDAALELGDWAVYLTSPFFTASYVLEVVCWSMAADLVPNPVDQAKIFPLLVPLIG